MYQYFVSNNNMFENSLYLNNCNITVLFFVPLTLLWTKFTVQPDACALTEEEDVDDPLVNNEFRQLKLSSPRNSDYCDTRVAIL